MGQISKIFSNKSDISHTNPYNLLITSDHSWSFWSILNILTVLIPFNKSYTFWFYFILSTPFKSLLISINPFHSLSINFYTFLKILFDFFVIIPLPQFISETFTNIFYLVTPLIHFYLIFIHFNQFDLFWLRPIRSPHGLM